MSSVLHGECDNTSQCADWPPPQPAEMHSFPVLRSFQENVDIIREWQSTMSPSALLTSMTCLSFFKTIHCPTMYCLDRMHVMFISLCPSCCRALRSSPPRQPRDSIANFQYYAYPELPREVGDALRGASTFDIIRTGGRVPEEAVQRFNRGNVAVLPQDPVDLHRVLPPSYDELRDSVCVVFSGGRFKPTVESLQCFRPVLVNKSNREGVSFSQKNLDRLVCGEGDCAVFPGIEIHHLPSDDGNEGDSVVDWSNGQEDLVMENVAYTQGDHSERSRNAMKARAFAYAMDQQKFLLSLSDPWGIGGFNHPARLPTQHISFERQVRNLLRQVDSPFSRDAIFAFICWNMIQKKEKLIGGCNKMEQWTSTKFQ